jgi:hypothetical protein
MKKNIKQLYQFKVTLAESKPPIWRRVIVPAEFTLNDLHDVIQACFAWDHSHLFDFEILGGLFNDQSPSSLARKLHSLKLSVKDKLKYTYDFGDNWLHILLLEKVLPYDERHSYPYCVTGKRAAPPEDCGGIWGYDYKLEVLANKNHPEYEDISEWMGDDTTPELFDLDHVNQRLEYLRNKK